jgi:hypothetical protein
MNYNRFTIQKTNYDTRGYYSNPQCCACVEHSRGLDTIGKCFYCYRENKDFTMGWYVENGQFIKDKSYMDWNTYVKYREYLEKLENDCENEYECDL